jgi:hypothetical protein
VLAPAEGISAGQGRFSGPDLSDVILRWALVSAICASCARETLVRALTPQAFGGLADGDVIGAEPVWGWS